MLPPCLLLLCLEPQRFRHPPKCGCTLSIQLNLQCPYRRQVLATRQVAAPHQVPGPCLPARPPFLISVLLPLCRPQVVLREEEREPRRRTKIVPMLAERHKMWRMREAQGVPSPA